MKIPREGVAFSCDDLCIPVKSAQVDLAHKLINFVTAPADFRENDALFPSPEIFAKCEPIDDLGDDLAL